MTEGIPNVALIDSNDRSGMASSAVNYHLRENECTTKHPQEIDNAVNHGILKKWFGRVAPYGNNDATCHSNEKYRIKSDLRSDEMKFFRTLGAACALSFLAASASAATLTINSFDNGRYIADGSHSPNNTNIFAGENFNGGFRNFFAFDLSAINGHVVSATLTIFSQNGVYINSSNTASYIVSDVVTSLSTLLDGTGGTAAYADLGSGTQYGSTTVSTPGSTGRMPAVVVNLSGGISDINSALGGSFALGGKAIGVSDFLWGASGSIPAGKLTLEVAAVPLPATLPLLLAALGGLGFAARRRKVT